MPRRSLVIAVVVATATCKGPTSYPVGVPVSAPDAAVDCGLVTCASANATCGPIGDGCGEVIECGTCTAPDFCGGDGTLFTCGGGSGSGACVPRTCADADAACGKVADGCGGLTASCGNCGIGEMCGGSGVANTCAVVPCTGLCLKQNACTDQAPTLIEGTVTAPGHDDTAQWGTPDPIYGALVYVPNGSAGPPSYGVTPFAPGVACESCSSSVSGSPLVSATTGVDGAFTLTNAPCGTAIPLVIQLGRWRRQISIPSVPCCATTTLAASQTHLPRTSTGELGDVRSDIPLIAVSTGDVDTLHCVLRKIGLDDSEFTDPSGAGRVHLYVDNGAEVDAATPAASVLYGSASELAKYDMALFECVGARVSKAAADQQRVIDFANAGGRVFATHYSYVWLTDSDGTTSSNTGPKPFSQTATWLVDQGDALSVTGHVDETLQGDPATQSRRLAFADWLVGVGASTTAGQLPLTNLHHDSNAVSGVIGTAAGTPAQRWLYTTDSFSAPLQYTFDTPIAYPPLQLPTTQCGRVSYSDFHVSNAASDGATFPTECDDAPMTPQEKALEFELFDLASCVGPQPGACTPKSCHDLGIECGPSGDGCDDSIVLECGGCANGRTCGAGGPSMCGTGLCAPRSCADANTDCGVIGDGCGGTDDCGTCPDGQACGGGGIANSCGVVLE